MKTAAAILLGFALFMTAAIASSDAAPASCGKASWYAMTSLTASGERASLNTMTAAHRTLPFGTKVRVTNQRNGKAVVLRINDRGPFTKGRIIDVTKVAASQLGFLNAGWTQVKIEPLNKLDHPRVQTVSQTC
ncbi:MAG: septal ring lytic transglycosylase RlpA family protein [Pseudomonadota bacterium]